MRRRDIKFNMSKDKWKCEWLEAGAAPVQSTRLFDVSHSKENMHAIILNINFR